MTVWIVGTCRTADDEKKKNIKTEAAALADSDDDS